MSARRLAGLLATVLIGAVVAPLATATPAGAASGYCAKGRGVTVVVDRGSLGGGTSIGCDLNGANTAGSTVVPRAGFPLTYVQRQPGFVCRVSGVPASASCGNTPPANAYWGLFWSNGTSGTWTYSSTGIGSLKVPAGGFIGWRWQNSNTRANPGTAPVSPAAASPKPAPKPSPKPASKPAPKPSAGSTSSQGRSATGTQPRSASPSPSAGAKATAAAKKQAAKQRNAKKKAVAEKHAAAKAQRAKKKKAQASASASASESAGVASDETSASPGTRLTSGEQASDNGSQVMLPIVAAGLLVLLLGAAGRLVWARRKG